MDRTCANVLNSGTHLYLRNFTTRRPRPIGRYLRDGLAIGWTCGLLDKCLCNRGDDNAYSMI